MDREEYIDKVIEKRLNAIEDNIKTALEMLLEIYAEKRFITYLNFLKKEAKE